VSDLTKNLIHNRCPIRVLFRCEIQYLLQPKVVHELEQDSIRPAEAVLYGILAPGRQCTDVLDVIFLKQPAGLAVNVQIILYPTFRTEIGFVCETIVLKACENDPLQRSPAVRCVPLLTAIV